MYVITDKNSLDSSKTMVRKDNAAVTEPVVTELTEPAKEGDLVNLAEDEVKDKETDQVQEQTEEVQTGAEEQAAEKDMQEAAIIQSEKDSEGHRLHEGEMREDPNYLGHAQPTDGVSTCV